MLQASFKEKTHDKGGGRDLTALYDAGEHAQKLPYLDATVHVRLKSNLIYYMLHSYVVVNKYCVCFCIMHREIQMLVSGHD